MQPVYVVFIIWSIVFPCLTYNSDMFVLNHDVLKIFSVTPMFAALQDSADKKGPEIDFSSSLNKTQLKAELSI